MENGPFLGKRTFLRLNLIGKRTFIGWYFICNASFCEKAVYLKYQIHQQGNIITANHNKDYSVVKTFKVERKLRLFLSGLIYKKHSLYVCKGNVWMLVF